MRIGSVLGGAALIVTAVAGGASLASISSPPAIATALSAVTQGMAGISTAVAGLFAAVPAEGSAAPAGVSLASAASLQNKAATAPSDPASTLSQADVQMVAALVRNTLVALHQADITGNYTVLRDLGAPSFRERNTATTLANLFARTRMSGIDLSQVVVLDPHLTSARINDQGMLTIAGSLATHPAPVNFNILYQGVAGSWQLFALSISADVPQVVAQADRAASSALPAK